MLKTPFLGVSRRGQEGGEQKYRVTYFFFHPKSNQVEFCKKNAFFVVTLGANRPRALPRPQPNLNRPRGIFIIFSLPVQVKVFSLLKHTAEGTHLINKQKIPPGVNQTESRKDARIFAGAAPNGNDSPPRRPPRRVGRHIDEDKE